MKFSGGVKHGDYPEGMVPRISMETSRECEHTLQWDDKYFPCMKERGHGGAHEWRNAEDAALLNDVRLTWEPKLIVTEAKV